MGPELTNATLAISALVQAFSTIVLVVVTIYYTVQTKKTVDIMDRSAKAEFLPIVQVMVRGNECDDKTLTLILTNIGKGVAKRPVKITFPGAPDIYVNSLPVGEDSKVKVTYNLDYVMQLPDTSRVLCVSYQDVFGREVLTKTHMVEMSRSIGEGKTVRYLSLDKWEPVLP